MEEQIESEAPRILIIEDDPGHRKLMEKYVKRTGCRSESAQDGRSGIEKALSERFDLIFVDIYIPQIDGFLVINRIREAGIKTPVVAVTAVRLEGLEEKALTAGFDNLVQKPIDQAAISGMIEQYTQSSHA